MNKFLMTVAAFSLLSTPTLAQQVTTGTHLHNLEEIHIAHVVVSYKDLNLTDYRDAQKLIRRFDLAAEQACGPTQTGNLHMTWVKPYNTCKATAIKDAAHTLPQFPLVLQAYNAGDYFAQKLVVNTRLTPDNH